MTKPDDIPVLDRELEELGRAVHAAAPEPDPAFAAELGRRVRDGFPRERNVRAPRLPRVLVRKPVAALAVAGVLAILVAVPLALDAGYEQPAQEASSADTELSTPSQPRPAGAAAPMIAPRGTPSGGGFEPGDRERRIERSAALTLAAPGDRLDGVADGIVSVTDRHGGYVLRSSVTSGDEGGGATGGSFDLRIPSAKLRAALRDLSALGSVRSRTQSGQDITREYATSEDQLDAARAERRGLLRRLERADSDARADAIRARLDLVAGQIRSLRGRLRELRLRTDYVALSVTLEDGDRSDDGGSSGGFGGTEDALDDALGSLAGALNLALRTLGVLLPIALLGGIAWVAARLLRRRRREAALL